MAQSNRIKVKKTMRQDELGTEQLVLLWLHAKSALRKRRSREAKARAKRRGRAR
jgi:hypothetical protein